MLLKVTHLKSRKKPYVSRDKVVFYTLFVIFVTKYNHKQKINIYIYSLLGALKVSCGNIGNKILESLGAVRIVLISKSNTALVLGVFQ
ncbi:hypothetical protein ABE44_34615 [Bacillus thuringiensis]|nr:hypothetical protein [Bacillus thuringiensis]